MEQNGSKVFNDPIHGSVELPPLLIKIIDTPQFQRLRNIKQLGGGYFVYPGASHNRFEHSIGVAHLAGKLAKALKTRQPELDITDRDILCVQIAGLCHDLGHGPFSHLFDQQFIPNVKSKRRERREKFKNWTHEEASKEMFDHMVKSNDREDEPEDKMEVMMKKSGLKLPKDIDFIKEMIAGPTKAAQGQEVLPNDADFIKGVIAGPTKAAQGQEVLGINTAHWPYKGRKKEKSFLYEIVANKRNGIDVDKFDYLSRDCYYMGIQNNFDYRRFLKFVRVCEVDGQKQICTRDKEVDNLYDMFHTRYYLHRKVCQHKVNIIIQHMIAEAFLKADTHIKIEGSGGKPFTLSTAVCDMVAYTKLTDHVFEQILNCPETSSRKLKEAREILKKITNRRLYKFLGQTKANDKSVTQKIWKKKLALPKEDGLTAEDFVVVDSIMDYGMADKNPINEMRFYKKEEPNKAFKIPEDKKSMFLPVCYSEKLIRVYFKKTDDGKCLEAARKHFNNVKQELCQKPRAARDTVTPELIPGENVENDLSN